MQNYLTKCKKHTFYALFWHSKHQHCLGIGLLFFWQQMHKPPWTMPENLLLSGLLGILGWHWSTLQSDTYKTQIRSCHSPAQNFASITLWKHSKPVESVYQQLWSGLHPRLYFFPCPVHSTGSAVLQHTKHRAAPLPRTFPPPQIPLCFAPSLYSGSNVASLGKPALIPNQNSVLSFPPASLILFSYWCSSKSDIRSGICFRVYFLDSSLEKKLQVNMNVYSQP